MNRSSTQPRRHARKLLLAAMLGVLIVAAATIVSCRSDLARARGRIASGSAVAQTACGPIEYAVRGQGMPILVVHGAGGGFDQGLEFGAPLAARGFRIIAVSRFGYLRTPLPRDGSAAAQADAHRCLLDALGIPRAAVIGASAGAPSAALFALRHPDRCRALVLLVPALFTPRPSGAPSVTPAPLTRWAFATALRSNGLFWAADKWMPSLLNQDLLATPGDVISAASPAERARVGRMRRHIQPVDHRRQGLLNDAAVIGALEPYPLAEIAVPTLAISTADDLFGTWESARHAAAQIHHARFIGYTEGGHLFVGHQQQIIDEIAAFFAG